MHTAPLCRKHPFNDSDSICINFSFAPTRSYSIKLASLLWISKNVIGLPHVLGGLSQQRFATLQIHLVGDFNPSEQYDIVKLGSFPPIFGNENLKRCLKPPTRHGVILLQMLLLQGASLKKKSTKTHTQIQRDQATDTPAEPAIQRAAFYSLKHVKIATCSP